MTDEQIALARRAVACRGWRWMPGMLFVKQNGTRIRFVVELGTHAIGMVQGGGHPSCREPLPLAGVLLNLTDPATLGCLLALVREAWGDECACVLPVDYGPGGVMWVCQLTAGGRSLTARHWVTEAEALIAALEAAP